MTELDRTPVNDDSHSSVRDSGAGPEFIEVPAVRRWLAIIALALGGFGIGVTEFVTMGLLPNIAADLLPQQ